MFSWISIEIFHILSEINFITYNRVQKCFEKHLLAFVLQYCIFPHFVPRMIGGQGEDKYKYP